MPVKVFIEPYEGKYRAHCRTFGFEIIANTKAEASERMNEKIRTHVQELSAAGKLPETSRSAPCVTQPSCPNAGCSGCGSTSA